jgi:hypothetical protein
MSFVQYWFKLCRFNTKLNNETNTIKMTVTSFKAQLDKAFEAGIKHGEKRMADLKPQSSEMDLFNDLFGCK